LVVAIYLDVHTIHALIGVRTETCTTGHTSKFLRVAMVPDPAVCVCVV